MNKRGHGERCAYCSRPLEATTSPGKLAATRDHAYPRSKAAPATRIYGVATVWCCRQCNSLKADLLPHEWKNFMTRNPEWWTRPEYSRGGLGRKRRETETAPAKNANGPLPIEQTMTILREGKAIWREKYGTVPTEYADPQAQAAFDAVYRDRLHMLREQP